MIAAMKQQHSPKSSIGLQSGDRFMSTDEVSAFLSTPKATVIYWRVIGAGPRFYRQRRNIRYLASDVNQWATKNLVETEKTA
jgi:hypothetical protein